MQSSLPGLNLQYLRAFALTALILDINLEIPILRIGVVELGVTIGSDEGTTLNRQSQ